MSSDKTETDAGLTLSEEELFDSELRAVILPAFRLAVGMKLRREEAEDAVQEAALRAWRHRTKRRPERPFRPWFLAIVANQCRDTLRARWARILHLEAAAGLEHTHSESDPAAIDIRRALGSLSAETRLPLVLRFYLDLPYSEVAAILGTSTNGAKLRTGRAITRLRDALGIPAEA